MGKEAKQKEDRKKRRERVYRKATHGADYYDDMDDELEKAYDAAINKLKVEENKILKKYGGFGSAPPEVREEILAKRRKVKMNIFRQHIKSKGFKTRKGYRNRGSDEITILDKLDKKDKSLDREDMHQRNTRNPGVIELGQEKKEPKIRAKITTRY